MNLYLAGPMRGYEEFNFPAFFEAEQRLQKLGHVAVNPARHDKDLGFDPTAGSVTQQYLRDALAWDLGQVCRADGIVVLPGWRKSRGARAEVATARAIGIPIFILSARNKEPLLVQAHYIMEANYV